MKLDGPKKKGP